MAKCEDCNKEMLTAKSCSREKLYVLKSGKRRKAVPFGIGEGGTTDEARCHDCNVEIGGIHHHGCDMERCPFCGLQLISCDCEIELVRVRYVRAAVEAM